jgi:competence protein ComGC
LLVVIAIIALLVSILLPALSKAKGAARTVVCMSNMKSMNTAVAIYVDDNNRALPTALSDTLQDGKKVWQMPKEERDYWHSHRWPRLLAETGVWGTFPPQDEHMRQQACPEYVMLDRSGDVAPADDEDDDGSWVKWLIRSYEMVETNHAPDYDEYAYVVHNIDRIKRPSKLMMLTETLDGTIYEQRSLGMSNGVMGRYRWHTHYGYNDGPHSKEFHILMFDGAVRSTNVWEVLDSTWWDATAQED